jgi:hypothetical protein
MSGLYYFNAEYKGQVYITSMFTAIIVSRAIINKIYGGKKTKELSI